MLLSSKISQWVSIALGMSPKFPSMPSKVWPLLISPASNLFPLLPWFFFLLVQGFVFQMCPVLINRCAQAVTSVWVVHSPQGWSEEDPVNFTQRFIAS